MSREELFRMAVKLTECFVVNRDIGGRAVNPEDAVHDYVLRMYGVLERAWLEVGADTAGERGM